MTSSDCNLMKSNPDVIYTPVESEIKQNLTFNVQCIVIFVANDPID